MAGSMNIFETITGAYDAFTNGGFILRSSIWQVNIAVDIQDLIVI